MNRRLSLIIGAVLALIAVFLVRIYLNQQREALRIQADKQLEQIQQSQVAFLIAKRDISPGTALEPTMFEVAAAPASQVPSQVVTSFDQVIGREAVVPISAGEPVISNKLSAAVRGGGASSRGAGGSLSRTTPKGKRAMTIPIDNIASVGGMIKPGDNVDMMCLLSISELKEGKKSQEKKEIIVPLFQNVLVLAVGSETIGGSGPEVPGQAKAPVSDAKTVTLALTPQEANIIAFVQEQGKIRLILRSPEDSSIEPISPITWETLFMLFMPDEGEEAVSKPLRRGPKGMVEIYRGTEREVVPLSE